jgi:hypothetical protein
MSAQTQLDRKFDSWQLAYASVRALLDGLRAVFDELWHSRHTGPSRTAGLPRFDGWGPPATSGKHLALLLRFYSEPCSSRSR